jgi:hypothetical protein
MIDQAKPDNPTTNILESFRQREAERICRKMNLDNPQKLVLPKPYASKEVVNTLLFPLLEKEAKKEASLTRSLNKLYVDKRDNIKKTPMDLVMESRDAGRGSNQNLRKEIWDEYTKIIME